MKTLLNTIKDIGHGVYCCVYNPSGIILYGWQCGGYACNHRTTVGHIFKVGTEEQEDILLKHFTGDYWGGWCDDGIRVEDANLIEQMFPRFTVSPYYNRSCEAWIEGRWDKVEAVLFWNNSD